jgi:hypothetical protein
MPRLSQLFVAAQNCMYFASIHEITCWNAAEDVSDRNICVFACFDWRGRQAFVTVAARCVGS